MDIIEQLEEGKKAQENGEINEDLLRTKLGDEESSESPVSDKKKNKSKKEEKEPTTEEGSETPAFNLFEEAEQIMKPSFKNSTVIKENLVDPGFDFNNFYEIGQHIHFVQIHAELGYKEIPELSLRSIYPRSMVGVINKTKQCIVIGYDVKDFIFEDRKIALEFCNSIHITPKKDVSIEDELGDVELSDEDIDVAATEEQGEE